METLAPVTNGAGYDIEITEPYTAHIEIEGVSALLFHAWNNEAVEAKAKSAKGSANKKTDNLESYVYRDEDGNICLPGEYLRMAIVNAARYRQDPRSPRKSAMDLYKAGIVILTEYASLGSKDWDYLDRRRVTVQRAAITRERPAFKAGWRASFDVMVNTPEYISEHILHETVSAAGRLVGVGDFRPTYGRFQIVNFHLVN